MLEALCGRRLPGTLLPASGLALIIVTAEALTAADATAELATPGVVAMAVVGLASSLRRRRQPDRWAIAAFAAVFAIFAAPVVLSGEATFAGYIKLDDTATWMAITDRVMEYGHSVDGLPPSSYQATLQYSLGGGYPVGAFLPLGIGRALVAEDVAWVFQPYLALAAAMLALVLWELLEGFVSSPRLRAAAVFLAAQPALLFGYAMWGGIKEMLAALLVALLAALAVSTTRAGSGVRAFVPLVVAAGSVVCVLSVGGAVWLVPFAVAVALVLVRRVGLGAVVRRMIPVGVVIAILGLVVAVSGARLLPHKPSSLVADSTLGNLAAPLSPWQFFGVWPAGDFRFDPSDLAATYVLIALVATSCMVGLLLAWRARAWALLLYFSAAVLCTIGLLGVGSPWIGAKALAIASPAAILVALGGSAVIFGRGRRVEGAVLIAIIGFGVLWSNALAYRDVNLAPAAQLRELQSIGPRIAGEGPTLMTEYQPYGVRHFLRDADPEGASELRQRPVPLRDGRLLQSGSYADTDQLQLAGLLIYRTLVLRRSPTQSRPPSPYTLVYRGHYYDVWQRPTRLPSEVVAHLPLGTPDDPTGIPRCKRVMEIARRARPEGNLTAVASPAPMLLPIARLRHPARWDRAADGSSITPESGGVAEGDFRLRRPGVYELWVRGSVRSGLRALVDGREVGAVRDQLNNSGQYVALGVERLDAGEHMIALVYDGPDIHPGSGDGEPGALGPLALVRRENPILITVPPDRARSLCGKRWDWIEALVPPVR